MAFLIYFSDPHLTHRRICSQDQQGRRNVDEISGIASGKSTLAEHIVISLTYLGTQISNNQKGANLGTFVNWWKSCRSLALHRPRLVL